MNRILLLKLLLCCFYQSYSIDDSTYVLKRLKIVVLPPKIIFNVLHHESNKAKDLDYIEKQQLELYQKILESELYNNLKTNSYIENCLNTNQKLKDSGVDLKKIWTYSLNELARILNADIVYLLKIEQKILFSNFESYNLNISDLYTNTILYSPFIIENTQHKRNKLTGELSVFLNETHSISKNKINSIKIDQNISTENNIRKLIISLLK